MATMKATFTPGPWTTDGKKINADRDDPWECDLIATLNRNFSGFSNAYLIAAAPDLLKACEMLVEYVADPQLAVVAAQAHGDVIVLDPELGPVEIVRYARAAIAKARGSEVR